jgi:hypothetical protein
MGEDAKIAIRSIRRDANEKFKALKKKSEITEDDLKDLEKEIQTATDAKIKEIDGIAAKKEKEILEISRASAVSRNWGTAHVKRGFLCSPKASHAMWASSWTATAAGRRSAACLGWAATAGGPRFSARSRGTPPRPPWST